MAANPHPDAVASQQPYYIFTLAGLKPQSGKSEKD